MSAQHYRGVIGVAGHVDHGKTTLIKALTGIDDPRAVTLWTFILITPVSMLLALPWWSWPSAGLLPVLAALGACAAIGQLGLARALSLADASAVIPFDFVRFCLITLAGALTAAVSRDRTRRARNRRAT